MNSCPKNSSENVTTIRIHVDQVGSSQNYQDCQLKGKRRNKIKMPLKKIPKRKQTFTEQLKICQDINGTEYPQNLSALIVSSVQQNNDDATNVQDHETTLSDRNEDKSLSSGLPTLSPLESGSSRISNGGQQMPMNSVSRVNQMNPLPPPLVSVVRSLMNDSVPSTSITIPKVGNTETLLPRVTTQASVSCQLKDETTGFISNRSQWQNEEITEHQYQGNADQSFLNFKSQGTIFPYSSNSSLGVSNKDYLNWDSVSQTAKNYDGSIVTSQRNAMYGISNSGNQGSVVHKCSVSEDCLRQSFHGPINHGSCHSSGLGTINKICLNTLTQEPASQRYPNLSSQSGYINQGYSLSNGVNHNFPHHSKTDSKHHEYSDQKSQLKSVGDNFYHSTAQGSNGQGFLTSAFQKILTQSSAGSITNGMVDSTVSGSLLQLLPSYEPTNELVKTNPQDHLVHMDQIKSSDLSITKQNKITRLPNRKMPKFNGQEAMMNKSYLPDMRLPLVQVKQPLMTPISPENKRTAPKRSSLMFKRQQEGSTIGAKGRFQIDNSLQVKENVEFDTAESSCSRSSSSMDHRYQKQDDDDDDVIITGIVNLNELNRAEELKNAKSKISTSKRGRNSKRQNSIRKSTDSQQNANIPNDNVQNRPRKYNKRGNGRKATRGRYAGNKVISNENLNNSLLMSFNGSEGFSHINNIYDNGYSNRIENSKVKTNTNTILIMNKNNVSENIFQGHSDQMKLDNIKCNVPSDVHENKLDNYLDKVKMTEFDWKSCLTMFDNGGEELKKTESTEAGSGTDSGEDDAVLRDLSEFLMLSEDRRLSSKKPINPDINEECLYSYQSNDGTMFTKSEPPVYNYNNNISTVNLDSLIESEMKNCLTNRKCNDSKYSPWHSLYDNYPKPSTYNNKYKTNKTSYWKRYMLTDNDPLLTDSEYYNVDSTFINRDKCLEEFINGAGYITRQDRERATAMPDMRFYKKRIYRKKSKTDTNNGWCKQ